MEAAAVREPPAPVEPTLLRSDDDITSTSTGTFSSRVDGFFQPRPEDPHEPSSPEVQPQEGQQAAGRELADFIGNELPEAVRIKHAPPVIIRTTPYRFLIIILFAVFGFINQLQYVAFATIIRESQAYFGVDALSVNVLSLLVPVVYVIGVVPGCYVYNRVGLRYGMIIGAATNAFASLLKFISVWAPFYPLLVAAQVFVAGGQILFLSLPTLIAGIWFPPSERTLATAAASLLGFAGMAVGMFYSPHVVSLPDNNTRQEWGGLMGSQFGLSMLVLILIAIFARDKPQYRPSQTATEDYKLPLARFLKTQMRDWNFLLLGISFGLIAGFLTALAGMLAQVLEPYGIEEEISGILAFSGILGGAANCGVIGYFVDRTHYYKYTAIALTSATTVLLTVATVCIKTIKDVDSLAIALYVLVPLLEFLVLPIVPVVMELAVELAYPCPETVPSTLVLASMCLFSFIGMIVFSIILGDEPTTDTAFYCVLVTLIVSGLSIVGLAFVRERLRRQLEDDVLDHEAANEANPEEDEEEDVAEAESAAGGQKKKLEGVQTGIASTSISDQLAFPS